MIYVVVPVFNEEASQVRNSVLELLGYTYEVVLINDGWDKNLKEYLFDLPIHYLRHSINLGQGAALQTGVEYALRCGAHTIVHFDADGQHKAADVLRLVESLNTRNYDIILGSRFLKLEDSNEVPVVRKVILQLARLVNLLFTGLLLSDAHNGLRALNKTAAEKVYLTENRFAHATEILFEIKRNKLRYKEIPTTVNYSNYSMKKGQGSLNMFRILLDLVLSKIFR